MALQAESMQLYARPGNNTGLGTLIVNADVTGLKAVSPTKMQQDSNILHDKMIRHESLVAATISKSIYIVREGIWVLDSVTLYFQTGSTSGTVTVTVDTGTNAAGAGTAQLTAALSLAAAVQQVTANGVLITTPTEAGPGARFSLLIAGTMTSLADGGISVALKRIR